MNKEVLLLFVSSITPKVTNWFWFNFFLCSIFGYFFSKAIHQSVSKSGILHTWYHHYVQLGPNTARKYDFHYNRSFRFMSVYYHNKTNSVKACSALVAAWALILECSSTFGWWNLFSGQCGHVVCLQQRQRKSRKWKWKYLNKNENLSVTVAIWTNNCSSCF